MILSKSIKPRVVTLMAMNRSSCCVLTTTKCWLSTATTFEEPAAAAKRPPSKILSHPNFKLGFIGTGKIAQAIISGLISKEQIQAHQIYASDSNANYLKFLRTKHPLFAKHKINLVDNNQEVLSNASTVLLCVKPNEVVSTLTYCSNDFGSHHLLISLAAGICLNKIENILKNNVRVVRIMTNLAALVQQGCSVFSKGTYANAEDAQCVRSLLESIGTCEGEIKEELLDVVTALSGSSPAYMFLILDALADGGVKMGLTRDTALKLATQTMYGSACMLLEELNKLNGKHLMQMKEEVCSPGGTTIYGIAELEKYNLRSSLIKCIEAGTKRAREFKYD